jgi:hypothetical protein
MSIPICYYYLTKHVTCFFRSQDHNEANNGSGSITSIDKTLLRDPKEWKRQRERERYAQLSNQQKDELLKKRRKNRQQKTVLVDLTFEQIEARRANARA